MPTFRSAAFACAACALVSLTLAVIMNLLQPDVQIVVAIPAGFPLLLLWVVAAAWSIVVAVILLSRRRRFTGIMCCLVPPVALIGTYLALPYVQYPSDYLHFRAMRATYDAAVARLPRDGQRFAEFNWGGMSFASKGVTYDETDEVARPFGLQSAAWKERMKSTDLTCGGDEPVGEVLPLGDHYYVTTFGC